MKASSVAAVGAVVLIIIVGIALTINIVMYGQSSNALLLLMGFASAQLPILMKMTNVETKVNGNYSEMGKRVETLESHYSEAMKMIPPEIAKDIPPLPTGEIPVVGKEDETHAN